MPIRFNQVYGNIYRGGAPSPSDLQMLSDIFGIKTIISLDGPIGYQIAPVVKKLGMEHLIIPIGGPESQDLIIYLRHNISNLLQETQPVYLHCRHGSDRTGMAVALFRMQQQGWPPEMALKEARHFGFGNKLSPETEQLYLSVLTGIENDVNEIADFVQDRYGYDNAGLPYQSFAPMNETPTSNQDWSNQIPPEFKDPTAFSDFIDHDPSEQDLRRQMLQLLMEDIGVSQLPSVGQYDNYSGIRGVGPVEPQFFLNL